MGKSKKKKRVDSRGYGGLQTPPSQSAASSNDVVVTKQTHEGIQSLVDQLRSSEIDRMQRKGNSSNNSGAPAPLTADSTIRFVPKFTKIFDRLIDLGFRYDADSDADDTTKKDKNRLYLEQMVAVLGYGITLESALDWLCLNVSTLELPLLFTDGNLRNNLLQEEWQSETGSSSSLTVLKFVSSSSSSTSTSQSKSVSSIEGGNTKKEEEIRKKDTERQQKEQERMKQIQKEKKIAKEKSEAEEREAAKKKLLEQYAEYHSDSESENGQDDNNSSAADSKISLTPQESELLAKENELNELEADLGCEANNYMRSKQEMKILRIQAKKLKGAVSGLRRKVENQRRQREQEQRENKVGENEVDEEEEDEEESGQGFFGGGGLFDDGVEDEKEEEIAEENTQVATDVHPEELLDCTIPKGWTGTTPRKTLEDTCKKQRLGKPKFLNLGGGSSGGYKLSGINVQKAKKAKSGASSGGEDLPSKDIWIALSSNFCSGSSLPDYLALKALYEIDSNKPLYGMFPPAFRSLWLSWLEEVQQKNDEIKQTLETKKKNRIQKLLDIIEANHRTEAIAAASNKNNIGNRQAAGSSSGEDEIMNEDRRQKTSAVEDTWESIDDYEGNDTKSVIESLSKAGKSLKREFLQRQSTNTYAEMLRQRENLPMTSYRSEVLETIKRNQVMILCAETVSLWMPYFLLGNSISAFTNDSKI